MSFSYVFYARTRNTFRCHDTVFQVLFLWWSWQMEMLLFTNRNCTNFRRSSRKILTVKMPVLNTHSIVVVKCQREKKWKSLTSFSYMYRALNIAVIVSLLASILPPINSTCTGPILNTLKISTLYINFYLLVLPVSLRL